jgi:hypothetical protein
MLHAVGDTCGAAWWDNGWQQQQLLLLLLVVVLEARVLLVVLQQPCLLLLLLMVGQIAVAQMLNTPSCQGTMWGSTSCTARARQYSCVAHHDRRAHVAQGRSSCTAGAAASVSGHYQRCWRCCL